MIRDSTEDHGEVYFTDKEEKILEELPDELEEYIRLKRENQQLRREAKVLNIQIEKEKRISKLLSQAKEELDETTGKE